MLDKLIEYGRSHGIEVTEGFLFYGRRRRRTRVAIDQQLRTQTRHAIDRLHRLIQAQRTPAARYEKKCDRCSLKDLCLPQALRVRATAGRYLARAVTGKVGAELRVEGPESRAQSQKPRV